MKYTEKSANGSALSVFRQGGVYRNHAFNDKSTCSHAQNVKRRSHTGEVNDTALYSLALGEAAAGAKTLVVSDGCRLAVHTSEVSASRAQEIIQLEVGRAIGAADVHRCLA